MRTTSLLVLTAAAAVALTTAVPADAATPVAYRYSTTGLAAEALFSDAPADFSTVTPGVVYHDTYVSSGQQATRSDGTVSNGSFVYYDEFDYSFDAAGNFIGEGEVFGYADGAAVTLTESKKLASASLRATVATFACDAARNCTEGTLPVAVDWTGTGDVTHQVGNFLVHNRTLQINSHQNGYYRHATATGAGLGTSVYADLFSGKYSERCVGSGCSTGY